MQTVEKALDVIDILSKDGLNGGLGISELSSKLGMGKSTVHRLLDTLQSYNYVEKCPNNTKYRLGWKLFEIGNLIPQQRNLFNYDTKILEDLCNTYGETVNLGVRVENSVVTISKMNAKATLIANLQVGSREPLHATAMGKSLMAEMTREEIDNLYGDTELKKFTANTITSLDDLMLELEKIKKQGYSIDDEEFVPGLTCIAMPVRNYRNEVVAAVSVSGPSIRLSFHKIMDIKKGLDIATKELAAFVGYMGEKKDIN